MVYPARFYRDPAEAVAFDQSRALYARRGCFACRHCRPGDGVACAKRLQPTPAWCRGFDPHE